MPQRRGFSLVELMIVVAIVGVLAVLAIYGVRKYITNTKTAEARNSLGQIAKDAAAAFERESMSGVILPVGASASNSRSLCLSSSASVPSDPVSIQGKKYQSSPAEWNADAPINAGFACLKFLMDLPQYYMYSYDSQSSTQDAQGDEDLGAMGASFVAFANGDLDGNGLLSTFSIRGSITASMTLSIAPAIEEVYGNE